MKCMSILVLACGFLIQSMAFARATPVTEEVTLKNGDFSKLIYEALEKNKKPKKATGLAGGEMYIIDIQKGFSCAKSISLKKDAAPRYSCTLAADKGWNSLGMNSYGSGSNEKLSKALYNALGVQAEEESEGGETLMATKTIEMNVADGDGGTERNQISCVQPSEEAEGLGIAHSCQIVNAL